MRVIAGSARGRRLDSVPGETTRPITDRAKEALFSILGGDVEEARVLDLFAGTGSVGIEALSRGARACDFVDIAPAAVRTIEKNLGKVGLADKAAVLRRDSFRWLRGAVQRGGGALYDLVFVAPPQYRGLWREALLALDRLPELMADGATVVVQIHPREWTAVELASLQETDRRTYGSVMLIFFSRLDGEPPTSDAAAVRGG